MSTPNVTNVIQPYDHFTVPAISPVFWNLAIVAGLAIGVPQVHTINTRLYIYAVSIVVDNLTLRERICQKFRQA